MADQAEIDAFFEREMPGPETQPLFEEARRLELGFCMGYAELCVEDGVTRRYNTAILLDAAGRLVGKYRKVPVFNFARHRRPEHYRLIVERTGAIPPS